MIKNTTAVLQKSRCLSSEQAYIQNVMSIMVSTFIIRKCSPDAHHNIENICIFWSFSQNKKPCKCLIYRVLMLFITVLGRERGIRTPGRLPYNGFQDRRIRPLCHLSVCFSVSETWCKGKQIYFTCNSSVKILFKIIFQNYRRIK